MYCCSCRVAGICKRGHLSLTSYETHLGTSLIISEVSINNITQILRSCSFYIHSDSAQETEASKNDENSLPKETQECFQSPNFREDITRLVTFVNTLLIGLLRNEDIRAANLGQELHIQFVTCTLMLQKNKCFLKHRIVSNEVHKAW